MPTAGPLEDRLSASFDTVLETHCAFRRETTEPSEPNSVLGLLAIQAEVPLLQAGSTNDEFVQVADWSMFHIPVPARFQANAGSRAHGQIY